MIIVLVRRVIGHQGRVLFRPLNESAERLCLLLNQKTLTELDVERAKALGLEIRERLKTETETEEIL